MKIDPAKVLTCLKSFDFATLFREHLGWDKHQVTLDIPVESETYHLAAVAQKRGFTAYVCSTIPDRDVRRKIDHQVTKSAREHFVIYMDQAAGQQVWQWVRREPGKPIAPRDHRFDTSTTGEALIQRLDQIAVSLDEEEGITVVEVASRARAAFDVDKVTKKFYDRFKAEHSAFLKFIKGITTQADLEWYTSLMLNRLMFVYFIQKKGFLDGDTNYLQNRMQKVRDIKGRDKFHSFYRYFLIRLFHDGLGKHEAERKLDRDLETLLGKVPYLNGGFFEVHQLEERYTEIDIPDQAFENLFAFFDGFSWHLDERPLRAGNEINPDVVGYIFEKYINQKQMGAYYTKEDITDYISKNTIIPFLFDAAQKKCPIAFKPDSFLWRLLRDDPDRYIYSAVRHGVIDETGQIIPLPKEIEVGVKDVSQRGGWNKAAPQPFALPTETWREHVARRQRCLEIREKLRNGEVHQINELITLNLDIWQFARDAIVNSEGPELLRAFWHTLTGRIPENSKEKLELPMSVLDPTCGSGAFLFAALRILETLYSDCLERMERFVEDLAVGTHHAEKYKDFRTILSDIEKHPNERYYILKSIIIHNLYGVDIMDEAVEICKLRLFLKLVAQVQSVEQIEPLPDIDFNIRAGNTLVGYTSLEQVRQSQKDTLGFGQKEISQIIENVESIERLYRMFQQLQTMSGRQNIGPGKLLLKEGLTKLSDILHRYLAREYGIFADKFDDQEQYDKQFATWKESHQPFHWLAQFYGIMRNGGFDVIIGNPPYVEYSKVRGQYKLLDRFLAYSTNLFAACSYQAIHLKSDAGRTSFIVPISLPSTDRMETLRLAMVSGHVVYHTSFSNRPSKLFDGAEQRLTIYLQCPANESRVFSGGYLKWYGEERPQLLYCLYYIEAKPLASRRNIWPKVRGEFERKVLDKVGVFPELSTRKVLGPGSSLYYKNTGIRYFNTVTLRPPKCWINGVATSSSRETVLNVDNSHRHAIHDLLLSTVFLMYYQFLSNCRDLNPADISTLPLPDISNDLEKLNSLSVAIEDDYTKKGRIITMKKPTGLVELESVTPARSKGLIDEIDRVLAKHYGFTPEELDFIINYDIKYRMGQENGDGDDEE